MMRVANIINEHYVELSKAVMSRFGKVIQNIVTCLDAVDGTVEIPPPPKSSSKNLLGSAISRLTKSLISTYVVGELK